MKIQKQFEFEWKRHKKSPEIIEKVKQVSDEYDAKLENLEFQKDIDYGNFSRNRRNLKRTLLARNKICFWCDTELTFETATIDHIVPAAVRKDNSLKNLRLIHEDCRVMRDRAIAIDNATAALTEELTELLKQVSSKQEQRRTLAQLVLNRIDRERRELKEEKYTKLLDLLKSNK